MKKQNKVLAIPDLHFPWVDKEALEKVYKAVRKEKPTHIVQMGDLFDQYMFGRFDKNLNLIAPENEIVTAREMAVNFWKKVKQIAPRAKCYQLLGNHDIRLLKQCAKKLPESYHFLKDAHNNLYDFKGVETMKSERDFLKIDDVYFVHGWQAKHIRHFKGSVVRAHDHQAWVYQIGNQVNAYGGIVYKDATTRIVRQGHTTFEISCGMLADDSLLPFDYTNSKRTNWTPAIAVITKEEARLEIL